MSTPHFNHAKFDFTLSGHDMSLSLVFILLLQVPDDNIFDRLTALRNPAAASEPQPDVGGGVGGVSHEVNPPVVALSSLQNVDDGSSADVGPTAGSSSSWAQRVMAEARASALTLGQGIMPLTSGFNSGWVAMDQDIAQSDASSGGGGLSVKRGRCEETIVVTEPTLEPPPMRSSTLDGLPPSSSSLIPCHAPVVEGVAAPGSGSRLKKAGTAAGSRRSSDGGGGGGEGGRRVRFEGVADEEAKELDGGRDGQGQRGGRGSGGAGHGRWGIGQ